jgi:hypothetical protein
MAHRHDGQTRHPRRYALTNLGRGVRTLRDTEGQVVETSQRLPRLSPNARVTGPPARPFAVNPPPTPRR